ncbi:hypothetical protein [Shimia haliotis]|uniref:Uncharacterized protein n=2 Tax=Roseobacteraceae TaxID=2854170 RepID=A0A2T6C505_9RHOB|nr:hypothetical protein [Shimia haliotis]KIN78159.1 hypothetical protein Z950_3999 [Sulfitobacter mediterraneus KCTC 32188]PTX63399.1 hypothetical protein C8N31_11733 [Sulfitobacter mediterraneus]SFK77785.1 hypothetical protein SAMN04488036_102142 [Shimia haliotis]
MEVMILLWIVCAGLSYMVARDRAPSKAGLAAALGFLLGPLGVLISFFLKDSAER